MYFWLKMLNKNLKNVQNNLKKNDVALQTTVINFKLKQKKV